MRRLALCALLLTLALGGDAAAEPSARRLASYCSPSGDLCFGIFDRGGAVYLELSTFARYFARYRLCSDPPGTGAAGRERCRSFPVLPRGRVWGSTVRYGRRFPVTGPGVYRVTWRLTDRRLGPPLRFRLPLAR